MDSKRVITENLSKKENMGKFDRKFWRNAGHEARFAAAAEMIFEAELIRGKNAGESRLQRSVQNIKRRKS